MAKTSLRNLVIVLGDQLDRESAAFDDFDSEQDRVWMAEVPEEATHVPSHKVRIAFFLAAMRHFRDSLGKRDISVIYHAMEESDAKSFTDALKLTLQDFSVERLVVVQPGEYRVEHGLRQFAEDRDLPLEVLPDRHFLCDRETFEEHAEGRKELRLEYFYREMRRRTGVLMEDGEPTGGEWNYDSENRQTFGKQGPSDVPAPPNHGVDSITQSVLDLVESRFADHPGSLEHFNWPVTRRQALAALRDFIEQRLAHFGDYQDAMWEDEPYLYHSRISSALNTKLLNPREVIEAAEDAYRAGDAPLNAVEGFIRQILGWREFVRGIYWSLMPDYIERNALEAEGSLPEFYWTGETEMRCLAKTIRQTLDYGYAHHIQRLMITGLYAMLLGVHPREVHEWYLAVYVDAVEWVELPNTLGMSQYADHGVMGSKPYAATGNYVNKMSNYCKQCRYNPKQATGDDACPFTTLYWDFLARHSDRLSSNARMGLQLKNLERKDADELAEIRQQAKQLREGT